MANPTISAIDFNLATYKVYDAALGYDVDRTAQGTLYTVEGVEDPATGGLRKLSMAELVMVVCLARAAEKEKAIIDLMKTMSDNTSILESLTDIETKLLAGTSLADITGYYAYQGVNYSALDFLAIVIGGATPVAAITGSDEMVTLGNQLADTSNHVVDITGTYSYNGSTYTKAWEYLYARGLDNMSQSERYNFYNICDLVEGLPDGYVFSDAEVINISGYGVVNDVWLGMTKEDMVDQIDATYREKLVQYVQMLGLGNLDETGSITNAASYLPSSTDELITEIESKMDSLNSFSQQKMIELQSETNKRDQSYDLITNILKSLNTVEIGIVNNI